MKTTQTQIVVNVEQADKAAFNVVKTRYSLSDKELFAVLMKSLDRNESDEFETLINEVKVAKQAAKIQAKIDRLQAKINAATAEINNIEPEVEVQDPVE